MRFGRSLILLALFVVCAAAFVWLTGRSLPEVVASHFGSSGYANGFAPRGSYIDFMLGLIVGIPLLNATVAFVLLSIPGIPLNVPNRDYWLAPERQPATISFLRAHLLGLSFLLVTFLSYSHWLVVRANQTQPPHLSSTWFLGGLAVFIAAMLGWAVALLVHFQRRS